MSLEQTIKEIRELKTKRNEGILDIFKIMSRIKDDETWKKDSYYEETKSINVEEWKASKFSFILRQIAGWTMSRFLSIHAIIAMENGREIFLKYGYENSVALKNMSKKERPQVLAAVESHVASYSVIPGFYEVIHKVFPNKRQVRNISDGNEVKSNNLVAENKRLKKEIEALTKRIEALEMENEKLRKQVIEKLLMLG